MTMTTPMPNVMPSKWSASCAILSCQNERVKVRREVRNGEMWTERRADEGGDGGEGEPSGK